MLYRRMHDVIRKIENPKYTLELENQKEAFNGLVSAIETGALQNFENNLKDYIDSFIETNINDRGAQDQTLLMVAASKGNRAVINILIRNKAMATLRANQLTAAQIAAQAGHLAIADLLFKIEAEQQREEQYYHDSVWNTKTHLRYTDHFFGHLTIAPESDPVPASILALLAAPTTISAVPAIPAASVVSVGPVVPAIVAPTAPAAPTARDLEFDEVVQCIEQDNIEGFKDKLIKYLCRDVETSIDDRQASDWRRPTLLMLAASKGNQEIVEFLLEEGADLSLKDVGGRTAALYARLERHKELSATLENILFFPRSKARP